MVRRLPAARRSAVCGKGSASEVSASGASQRSGPALARGAAGARKTMARVVTPSSDRAAVGPRRQPRLKGAKRGWIMSTCGVVDRVRQLFSEARVELPCQWQSSFSRHVDEAELAGVDPILHQAIALEQINVLLVRRLVEGVQVRLEVYNRNRARIVLHIDQHSL